MTSAAFSLLKHASENREKWLSRFYAIGKEAVRPRKDGELSAFILPTSASDEERRSRMNLMAILGRARVEVGFVKPGDLKNSDGKLLTKVIAGAFKSKSEQDKLALVIPINQPYGLFAKAIIEKQEYPNLLDDKGNPIQPYDVTAHTISLLTNLNPIPIYEQISPYYILPKASSFKINKYDVNLEKIALYRSQIPSMDEGWTRWIFSNWTTQSNLRNIENKEVLAGDIQKRLKAVIFPDQSPNQILNGYPKGSMPDEYTGGIGKEGVENLRKFVEAGGTLVFLNDSTDFAIEQFDLPIRNVTKGLPRKDFYIPGSILRTELDTTHPIARGMPAQSIAWFENSPAFEITDMTNAKIIAKYPEKAEDIILSGWALGAEKIAGQSRAR